MKNLNCSTRNSWLWCAATAAMFSLGACNKNDDKPGAQLSLTSFSPAEGAEGNPVTLKGSAFSPDKALNTVKFNGVAATVNDAAANGSELTVIVPENATTGKITVTVGDKTVTSTTDFKVNPLTPQISAIAPEKGDVGIEVTLTGDRFTNSAEVYFGGTKATDVTYVSKTSLKAKVPAGALNGKVKVKVASLEAESLTAFWVRPAISGLSADKASEGAIIDINGTNFSLVTNENKVYFGTVEALEITEATATKLKVKVPADAKNDFVKVVVKEQDAVSTAKFTLLPTLTSYSPASVERGQEVTIDGKNLLGSEVFINGSPATIKSGSTATKLTVIVPNTAEAGKIVVKHTGVEQEFATSIHIGNYWKDHDMDNGPFTYLDERVWFIYNNKIYMAFNGNSLAYEVYKEVYSYDPAGKAWKHEFDIPAKVGLRRSPVSIVKGSKWYFGGGGTSSGPAIDFWVMDLTKTGDDAFTQLTAMELSAYADQAFEINNEIYVAYQQSGNAIYKFDPTGNSNKGSWTKVMNASFNGTLKNAFGIGNNGYIKDKNGWLYEFIPGVPSLEMKGSAPGYYNGGDRMFVVNNKLYNLEARTLSAYDPASNKWVTKAGFAPSQYLFFQVVNGRVWVINDEGQVYEYIY